MVHPVSMQVGIFDQNDNIMGPNKYMGWNIGLIFYANFKIY